MKLSWENVSLEVRLPTGDRLRVLKCLNGSAESGKLNVIMGPSGGGKTSFLNTLCGIMPHGYKTNGRVLLDGVEVGKDFLQRTCFLDQYDTCLDYYSVFKFLEFNAIGRNRGRSLKDLHIEINDMLNRVFLDKKKETLLSKLSGGERRRILIANELLSNNDILVLDEPTSGLDSHLALEVVNFLSEVARDMKKLVIITIHQPSAAVLGLADNFAFIYEGKMVYCGAFSELEAFLTKNGMERPPDLNLAEFLFMLGARKTFISKYSRGSEQFQAICNAISESDFQPGKSAKSDDKTWGVFDIARWAMVVPYLRRQLKLAFNKANLIQTILRHFVFPLGIAIKVAIFMWFITTREDDPMVLSNPRVQKSVLAISMWAMPLFFLPLFSLAAFESIIAESVLQRVENLKRIYTFTEWFISSMLFQLILYLSQIMISLIPFIFFCSAKLYFKLVAFTVISVPFAFIQALFFVSLRNKLPQFMIYLCTFGLISVGLAMKEFFKKWPWLKYPVFFGNLFPMPFLVCLVINWLLKDELSSSDDLEDSVVLGLTFLKACGVNYTIYVIVASICMCVLFLLSLVMHQRRISNPLRPKLERVLQ